MPDAASQFTAPLGRIERPHEPLLLIRSDEAGQVCCAAREHSLCPSGI